MDILGITITKRISTNTSTCTNFIHIVQSFLANCTFIFILIQCLGIIQKCFSQAVNNTGTILVIVLFNIRLRRHPFTDKITILRRIVRMRIVFLPVKKLKFTFLGREIRVIKSYGYIEARFTITIHIICTCISNSSSIYFFVPDCIIKFYVRFGKSLFIRTVIRKSVLHKESIDQRLSYP